MRRLSLTGIFLLVVVPILLSASNPHGENFKIACNACHNSNSWKLDKTIYSYDHNTSKFPLAGQHRVTDCRQCHVSLVFSDAKTGCADCHTDMHSQTVGPDCSRCHTPKSWIVENITEMHQRTRFPLYGAHYTADCNQCHKSASLLRFDPLGVACWDCHSNDYNNTTNPNHITAGYSKDCQTCHSITSPTWNTSNVDHSFFPLTSGHAIDCGKCHINNNFNLSNACVSCHQPNYNASANPSHVQASIPTTCADCHTTNPGWKPATFNIHNNYYVIEGAHLNFYNDCNRCHNGNLNTAPNTCYGCHEKDYNNANDPPHLAQNYPTNCLVCHNQTTWDGAQFDHSKVYPLTGAHTTTPCADCHTNGYSNTPNICSGCHMPNYNQSTNPNHAAINIPNTCVDCHTTATGWKPATFGIHNNYWVLQGAHTTVTCDACHNGNYNTAPNTCYGCHQANYNQTNNPPHASAQFPTDCSQCHTQTAWTPSTFNHDSQYFPIYSGKHNGEWTLCSDCHTNPSNYAVFTCITCHTQNSTNNKHNGVPGYSYNSQACYLCHPTGNGGKMMVPNGNIKRE
jgi:hypothetical protein